MIIMTTIPINVSTSKITLQYIHIQYISALFSLDDSKFRLALPTNTACAILKNRNTEAAFAVYKADYPLHDNWPFLLIVRTAWIVTVHLPQPNDRL